MIDDDSNRSGEVKTANSAPDGNLVARIGITYASRKTEGLLSEEQVIPMSHFRHWVIQGGVFAKSDHISAFSFFSAPQKRRKVFMMPNIHLMPVVQPSSFEMFVIHFKAERVYQV
jgi:hypothetical protein